jgi:hypothetical protein
MKLKLLSPHIVADRWYAAKCYYYYARIIIIIMLG